MKSILFKQFLIDSIIEGKKTETRRLVGTNTKPKYDIGEIIYIGEKLVKLGNNGVAFENGKSIPNAVWKWKRNTLSPMFMPEKYARLFIRIIGIKTERLHDISEEDAIAEGMPNRIEAQKMAIAAKMGWYDAPVKWFRGAWDEIHGKDESEKWDANPEVFVYKFVNRYVSQLRSV